MCSAQNTIAKTLNSHLDCDKLTGWQVWRASFCDVYLYFAGGCWWSWWWWWWWWPRLWKAGMCGELVFARSTFTFQGNVDDHDDGGINSDQDCDELAARWWELVFARSTCTWHLSGLGLTFATCQNVKRWKYTDLNSCQVCLGLTPAICDRILQRLGGLLCLISHWPEQEWWCQKLVTTSNWCLHIPSPGWS